MSRKYRIITDYNFRIIAYLPMFYTVLAQVGVFYCFFMNNLYDLSINKVTDLGFGVAELNGKNVFVDGTYTGEKVKVLIQEEHPTYYSAELREVLEPSPFRIEHVCRCASCGGCSFDFIEQGELLRLKNEFLVSCLKENGIKFNHALPKCIGMDDFRAYRNKAIYYVRNQNGEFVIGFFAKHSHNLIKIDNCILEPECTARTNAIIADWANEFGISAYDEKNGNGLIKNIVYRFGVQTDEKMLVIVAADYNIEHLDELVAGLSKMNFSSIWLCKNDGTNNNIWTEDLKHISGNRYISTRLCNLKFELAPRSFFQLNSSQCEKLYQIVLDFAQLKSEDLVFDLYCGIGTISLLLARNAKKVYGIEIIPEATENAKTNAELNGLNNVEFISGKSEIVCEKLVKDQKVEANVVVVDPPRKGCDVSLISTLLFLKAEKIIYVSCNPKSLARDLKLLTGKYNVERIATVDLFPNTLNVETVVLMSRK